MICICGRKLSLSQEGIVRFGNGPRANATLTDLLNTFSQIVFVVVVVFRTFAYFSLFFLGNFSILKLTLKL